MLIDRFGRQITYLRVSVTDRCNLRCVYCMPPEGVERQPHENILRYEEILKVVEAAAAHGVTEVRLTGGEPLVRRGLPDLVRLIAGVPGIADISLTTNGILLESMARPLAEAGLKRVNLSLDTLDPEKFSRITRGGSIQRVFRGLEAAEQAGLSPIKINVVAMRGVNDDELLDLARLSLEHPWNIRFIELMPFKNQAAWGEGFPPPDQAYLSVQEILSALAVLELRLLGDKVGSGPAQEFSLPGGRGTVGVISPLGNRFCQDCNRLRLTADGYLRPCLLNDGEVSIRAALRAGLDLLPYLQEAVQLKPRGHELDEQHAPNGRCMGQIGG
jgi:cyclic pyranopterin phosphate synthase